MPENIVDQPQSLSVYRAEAFRVVTGANLGDGLGIAEDLVPDDVYRLSPLAAPGRLSLRIGTRLPFTVAGDSDLASAGHAIHLDSCATFMCGDGSTTEILVMVETDAKGMIADIFLLPLAPLDRKLDYVLVGVTREGVRARFAQVACVSFSRGTRITLASGAQLPIEDLRVGDRVLTRDDGAQEVRWIGQTTLRASGDFAPICIRAGVLNNAADLVVSPDHRLFIYQRTDRLGAGRPELLVRARHLVNGTSVLRLDGGFVEYFQLLFDHHQIIYAEGIAAESLLLDNRTRDALPEEATARMADGRGTLHDTLHGDLEVQEGLLRHPDAAEILRRSSTG